jgi:predicted transcriptional regulator YdeE
MEPVRQHQDGFAVAGPCVRTTNRDEMDPATGRIPALWGRFFGEIVMDRTPHRDPDDLRNFGVYSTYESDAAGALSNAAIAPTSRPTAARSLLRCTSA